MRQTTLSAGEVAEMDETKNREQRSSGFALMGSRDSGAVKLSNGILMNWHVSKPDTRYPYRRIEPGTFILRINGKDHVFDADEFGKFLRWT